MAWSATPTACDSRLLLLERAQFDIHSHFTMDIHHDEDGRKQLAQGDEYGETGIEQGTAQ